MSLNDRAEPFHPRLIIFFDKFRFLDGAPLSTKFPTEFAMEAFGNVNIEAKLIVFTNTN